MTISIFQIERAGLQGSFPACQNQIWVITSLLVPDQGPYNYSWFSTSASFFSIMRYISCCIICIQWCKMESNNRTLKAGRSGQKVRERHCCIAVSVVSQHNSLCTSSIKHHLGLGVVIIFDSNSVVLKQDHPTLSRSGTPSCGTRSSCFTLEWLRHWSWAQKSKTEWLNLHQG